MKSIKSDKKCEPKVKFPCLMVGKVTGVVVLMTGLSEGMVVHAADIHGLGQSLKWPMDNFKTYNGSVCLEN